MNFTTQRTTPHDVSTVFAAFIDFENAAKNIRGIESIEVLTDGPIAKGTRFRETRRMFKREATEEMTITEFHEGQSYEVSCLSCGCEYQASYRFTPDAQGTRIDFEMRSKPLTLIAKVMAPVGNLLMGSTMRKCIEGDIDDLVKAL